MDKYYKPIASIALQHEYYADKNLHAATVHPFPETALFFRNHRILFKRKNHYYVLLQEAELATHVPTISFGTDPQYLCFGVKFNDTHYQLRSGLNYDPRQKKIVVETGEEETVSITEQNIVPCWTSVRSEGDEPVIVTDKDEAVVFSSGSDPKNVFDRLDTGLYNANGIPFFKCTHSLEYDAVFIFKLPENEKSIDKKINMPAGNYHWRYRIQKKYTQHNALSVVDENEKIDFKEVDSDKENHAVFFSKEPVQLSEQAITSLSLYNNESIIKKYLPVPELTNARFLSAEEKTLILEAYITI